LIKRKDFVMPKGFNNYNLVLGKMEVEK